VCVCVLFGVAAEAKVYKSYDDVLKSADKAEIAVMKAALEKAGYGEEKLLLDGAPVVFAWFAAPANLPDAPPRYIPYGVGGIIRAGGYPEGGTFAWSCGEWSDETGGNSQVLLPGFALGSHTAHVTYTVEVEEEPVAAGADSGSIIVFAGDLDVQGIDNDDPEDPEEEDPEADPGALIGLDGARREITLTMYPASAFPASQPDDYHYWTAHLSCDPVGKLEFWDDDDGGNEVTDLSWEGHIVQGQWEGEEIPSTLYVQGVDDGEVTVTFTCHADDHYQIQTAAYTDTVKFAVAELHILQDAEDITNTTHDEIVGKRINLQGQVLPVGLDISAHQWTIPGSVIADFHVGQGDPENGPYTPGEVVPLEDLTQDSVEFYWHDGGDGRQVHYSITIGEDTLDCVATFDVKRPQAEVTTVTRSVEVNEDPNSAEWFLALRFGTPEQGGEPGIEFHGTVTMPNGFSGETCYCQLYNQNHRLRLEQPLSPWQEAVGEGLDNDFPYKRLHWSVAIDPTPETDDTPALELTDGADLGEVSDSATMWLMFKPEGDDSIWVPLRRVDWWWQGRALKQADGTWELDWGANSIEPEDADTTSYPTWTYNIEMIEWVWVE